MIKEQKISSLLSLLKKETVESGNLNVNYILNQFRKNPAFYLFYPFLFKDYFEIENESDVDNVSVAGFLFYLSLLHTDYLTDTKNVSTESKTDKLFLIQNLTEQSIKILTTVFPKQSELWKLWAVRQREQHNSKEIEQNLLSETFTKEQYEKLADYKSSFGKAAIDCCYVLSSDKNKFAYDKLLTSHKYFSVAFQILDDLSDIRTDLKNGQFNYAVHIGKKNNHFTEKNKITQQIEAFYKTALPIKIMEEALAYLNKAEACLDGLPTNSQWEQVIRQKKNDSSEKMESIAIFFKVNHELSQQSQTKLFKKRNHTDTDLENAIQNGLDYILKKFNDNHWEDYVTQGGISNGWATSFIGYHLRPFESDRRIATALDKSEKYLHRFEENFSYNEKWQMEDADSLNFAFLFIKNPDTKSKILERLLKFQNNDGGFATYNNPGLLKQFFSFENFPHFDGWCQSHPCVSAVSLHALYENRELYPQEWNNLTRYCISQITNNEAKAYWWTNPVYSMYFYSEILDYICKKNESLSEFSTAFINQVCEMQNKDGSFSDTFGKNLFYTGYGLKTMLTGNTLNSDLVEKSAHYIIRNQFSDGSWTNSAAMRIPNPDNIIPEDESFAKIKTFGTDCRQLEFNRLFTTSVCVNALLTYQNFKNENKNQY
ncbi:hypothetical protein [Flavobacterium saliperosum]|uniref:Squalene-hopene cyclase C-terminal domain-containing protein n=1 Tax=Flavobacterium saliperosum TaxID=329186 RepID=A0A1G4V7Z2_9FLAO|nr:hypothetical protein [Flavobacterium saliperosum]SCX02661.1 hypothetical protein SAMN02927925_00543 [Flavobacterium saliperosum]